MKRLSWPAIGSTHTVPLYTPPIIRDGESPDAFGRRELEYDDRRDMTVRVRLQPRAAVRDWAQTFAAAHAAETMRAKAARDRGEPESVFGMSPEGVAAFVGLNRAIVMASCAGVDGADYGGQPLDAMTAEARVDALEAMDLLGAVASVCQTGQSPRPAQLDS